MENWLNKRAQLSPQKTAIVYQGQRFSFAQVAQKVHQQAQLLQGLKILKIKIESLFLAQTA